jgi:hypothetical protein
MSTGTRKSNTTTKYSSVSTGAYVDDDHAIDSTGSSSSTSSSSSSSSSSPLKESTHAMHSAKWRNKLERLFVRSGIFFWVLWVHFGVSFLKSSIYLSVFFAASQLDILAAITISLCFAVMDYAVHSIFNHQHLSFNLSSMFAMSIRKLIFKPLLSSGHIDTYGFRNGTIKERVPTFLHELVNMGALVVGSIAAASFNIRVVFPQKSDMEDWKFISHTRSGLSSTEVFGIGIIGFFFFSTLIKQMHFRIKTNMPLCAKGVSCDVDCALDFNQSAVLATVSFMSSFWLFVALRSPNNMVVMLGASIIAGDYSNLGVLFGAELIAWFVVEHAYYAFNRRCESKNKCHEEDASKSLVESALHVMYSNNQLHTSANSDGSVKMNHFLKNYSKDTPPPHISRY